MVVVEVDTDGVPVSESATTAMINFHTIYILSRLLGLLLRAVLRLHESLDQGKS
jgi:hypothetical protein